MGTAIKAAGVWLLGVLLLLALVVGVWVFRVTTSDIKGQGDAEITKNSAENRIAAQERFEALYAEVLASDRRLDQLAKDAKDGTTETRTRYSGAVSHCHNVVADYNAEARKFTARDYRELDLPAEIDQTDSATDCKEN